VATEVTLPELGESVTEGTITAWLVKVGEQVEADQPLFELSSDKIDTEVPAPVSGVLKEIKVQVDETVDVGTVVAVIGRADQEPEVEEAGAQEAEVVQEPEAEAEEPAAEEPEEAEPEPEEAEEPAAEAPAAEAPLTEEAEEPEPEPKEAKAEAAPAADGSVDARSSNDGDAGAPMSPLVRRMVVEHDLEVAQIRGTGKGGRITRSDVEATLSHKDHAPAATEPERKPRPQKKPEQAPQPARTPRVPADTRTRVENLSRIRQRIAAKMMESLQSSAQLTTMQEADVTSIMRLRSRVKDEFRAREGVTLSPFVFLCRAAVLAIRNHPALNALADWEAGAVTYHEYVNLGIAVDTERGLVVPNIKGADDLSLAGLARAIAAVASKARGEAQDGSRLEIADIQGGTFTMTNTGSRGVLIDTPILNYPEVAILATGAIKKRPVVIEDDAGPVIAVRDMLYLCLTYDHRLIDGADAARFVTAVQEVIETHDWAAEIGY
jgi:pyruvate dehydrogenase E2 component (dihydrolipoamide acetyltransferase)